MSWWQGETMLLDVPVPYAPQLAIPVFLGMLVLTGILVQIVSGRWAKRLTQRTATTLDDVIADGIPGVVRPVLYLLGLHVVAQALIGGEARITARLTASVIAILVVSFVGTRLLLRVVDVWSRSAPRYMPLGPPIKLGIKIVYVPLVGLMMLQTLEVEILPLLTTVGVGSLAIALALQDTLANVFAGIQLVIDQPIRGGDFIEVDTNVRGTVHEIGLRSTKIRTLDNNMIIVPNSTLATTIVKNNDAFDPTYAHRFVIGVSYDCDTRHVQRVLEEICALAGKEIDGLIDQSPGVRFIDFGDSALTFRVEVRLKQYIGRRGPLGELNHRIHARFAEEQIDIPFPMRTVILKRGDDTLETDQELAQIATAED